MAKQHKAAMVQLDTLFAQMATEMQDAQVRSRRLVSTLIQPHTHRIQPKRLFTPPPVKRAASPQQYGVSRESHTVSPSLAKNPNVVWTLLVSKYSAKDA